MDLLTKYRPIRTLEFYQKKVLRFIHNSEGTDDLRNLDIPYGPLGFDSPLHFIRCIPRDLCVEYENDKLFQRAERRLRKGYRVFLTSDDGKIQSAVYRGQKSMISGELGAILDGFKNPIPIGNVIPYKEFLRKNVGAMLIEGPHRVIGTIVTYEEPKWEIGDAVYYKPSKRWAVIEEREIYKTGKVYCKIKLEKSKTKREKVLWVGLWELMADAIPYRVPVIPQNNANAAAAEAEKRLAELDLELQKASKEKEKVENSLPVIKNVHEIEVPDSKKLNRQVSNDSAASIYSKDMTVIHTKPKEKEIKPEIKKRSPSKNYSVSSDTELVNLQHSPKSPTRAQNNYTEAPTITMRSKPKKPSLVGRPLTEFFHSQSEEVQDYQPHEPPTNKFISVSNLLAGQTSDEEEFTFEQYSNSLRRSARNILARQVAQEAQRSTVGKSGKNSIISKSSDFLNQAPKHQAHPQEHRSMAILNRKFSKDNSSTNVTSTSDSDSAPPPPLPQTTPPPKSPENQYGRFIQFQNPPPPYVRTPSVVEKYFVEPKPRNYENVNFHNHHGSISSNSNSLHDGIYSVSDIVDAVFTQEHDDSDTNNHVPVEYPRPQAPVQNPNLHHAYSVPAFDQKADFIEKYIDIRDYLYSGWNSKAESESNTSSMRSQKASRYTKNPSKSRGEHLQKGKSVPNILAEEQELFPQPFNSENVFSAVGKGRGIQTGYHSCYADVSLFSLFYCSNIFDRILLEELETDRGMKKDVKRILRQKIVKPIRLSAFCSRESVSHLREAMLPLSSKLSSSFMDPEEFLYLLFENALSLPAFLKYSNGTNDFMHQIIVRPKDRIRCHDVQFLFETSLEINALKLTDIPLPALMLCMPRCNGRLVYYEAIIPNLSLNITPLIDKGPKKCICDMAATLECALCHKQYGEVSLAYCQTCQKMAQQIHHHIGHDPVLIPKPQKNILLNLLAVICVCANYYSCFVKTGQDRFAPWLFFEATPTEHPQVIILEDFGRWLDKLEREPGRYREFAKMHPYLKRIITESHISIYFSPDAVPQTQFSESFMI